MYSPWASPPIPKEYASPKSPIGRARLTPTPKRKPDASDCAFDTANTATKKAAESNSYFIKYFF
jgi:hypothetical protein